jgi:hypothetical protein
VLSDRALVDLLVREIGEVDGAKVEQYLQVESFGDPRLDALDTIEALLDAADSSRTLVERVAVEFGADWVAIVRDAAVTATAGEAPDAGGLVALALGTAASPLVASGQRGPEDLLVAPIGDQGSLLVGRADPPFRQRERQQLLALGRIADRVIT